jgi:hypothetical protein
MITKEEFQNNFEKLVTKSDLEKVVDRVKREITTKMTEKMDKLECRIFELEIKNDDLCKKNKQTNTLLSPDTIQCTRCQHIKQIHSS